MLKQKIAQFKEYRKLGQQLKALDAQCLTAFKEYMVAEAKISIIKKRDFCTAWRRPHDELYGTINYPCIVSHEWEKTFGSLGGHINCADIESHPCKKYIEHSVCSDTTCFWYDKNRAAAGAWQKWQDAGNKYIEAKKEYDAAREQLFGKRKER